MFYKFLPMSMIDAPGLAAVVYTKGCNIRCPYCYNLDLLDEDETKGDIDLNELLQKIDELQDINSQGQIYNKIDWLIITGGEPMLHYEEVYDIIKKAKDLGLKVGIYTNGFYATALSNWCHNNLIDMIHLDIKGAISPPKEVIQQYWNHLRAHHISYLQLNTVCLRNDNIKKYLNELKQSVESVVGHKIKFCKKKFETDFSWTLTNFYNQDDRIQTFGKLSQARDRLGDAEFNSLF